MTQKKSPKLVHLSTAHPSRDNRIFNKECYGLAKSGEDVTLVIGQDGDFVEKGIKTVGIGKSKNRFERLIGAQFRAWKALKKIKPDVLHIHDPECIPTALLWKWKYGGATIYDSHEDLVGQMRDKNYLPAPIKMVCTFYARLLVRLVDQHFDAVVAATPKISTLFKRVKTVVVHNFPWIHDYAQLKSEPELGRCVYVGLLSKGRQIPAMLETVNQTEGAHVIVAGPAENDIKPLLENAPKNKVTYLGQLEISKIPKVIASSQIGLVFITPLPNYKESLPTKLFEYMAAGVPFMASNIKFWKEIVGKFDAGVFVDSNDTKACASKLAQLLTQPELCKQMGQRGRQAIQEHFNFDKDLKVLINIEHWAAHNASSKTKTSFLPSLTIKIKQIARNIRSRISR